MKKFLLSLAVVMFALTSVAQTKRYIWQNDGTHSEISWNGDYRFANEQNVTGEEIYAVPMSDWDIIKNGTFYLEAKGSDWVQMRITTGWWTTNWTKDDITTGDSRIVGESTGLYSIEINFAGADELLGLLDAQHLLFTGSGYTPMGIYVLEEDAPAAARKSFWKNGEQSTVPAPSWSGEARFSSVSHKTGEETYAFSEEDWATLKSEPFRFSFEKINPDWQNIRVTTGWWSTNYKGKENLNDEIQTEADGTFYIEVDLSKDDALLALLDDQHLLFTGDGYKLIEIYQVKDATAVKDVEDNKSNASAPIYNLAGQRITSPKGIYIQNGKKFMIK